MERWPDFFHRKMERLRGFLHWHVPQEEGVLNCHRHTHRHTDTHTDGHGDSRTESAQWGRLSENLVKHEFAVV